MIIESKTVLEELKGSTAVTEASHRTHSTVHPHHQHSSYHPFPARGFNLATLKKVSPVKFLEQPLFPES
jgi:hypothetical protein